MNNHLQITLAISIIAIYNLNFDISEALGADRSIFADTMIYLLCVYVIIPANRIANALMIVLGATAASSIFSKVVLGIDYRTPSTVTISFVLSLISGITYYLFKRRNMT